MKFLLSHGLHKCKSVVRKIPTHGEKFGGSARSTRRTDALNTRRAEQPLFSRTGLLIWGNHYPKLGEPLREILEPAVLSQALSSVWGNQCPNFRVDVTLN